MRKEEIREEEMREEVIQNPETRKEETPVEEGKEKTPEDIGNEKGKKGDHRRIRFLAGCCSLLFFMIAAGIVLKLAFSCVMTNTVGRIYWQNPFYRETEVFEESNEFSEMLLCDISSLSRYLAICSLFETDGEFNEDKAINIVSFAFRNDRKVPERLQNVYVRYKAGDLINWANAGFAYEPADSEWLNELETKRAEYFSKIYTDDGQTNLQIGLDEMETLVFTLGELAEDQGVNLIGMSQEQLAGFMQQNGFEKQAPSLVYAYLQTNEEMFEMTVDENGNTVTVLRETPPILQEDKETKLLEECSPIGKSSLYDLELPQDVSYREIASLIEVVANDLAENYRDYETYKKTFGSQRNLKYVVRAADTGFRHTNIDNVGDREKQKEKFLACNNFIIYDYASDSIVCQGLGQTNKITLKGMFRYYDYLFPSGGTVYVTVQDTDADKVYFGDYNLMDGYAQARETYAAAADHRIRQAAAFGMFLLLAVVSLTLFSILQPERTAGQLKGFDRLPAEPAIVLSACLEVGIFLSGYFMMEQFFYDENFAGGGYLHKQEFFVLLLALAFLAYLLWLIFWGSMIRRCKAHTLIRGSILYRLLALIGRMVLTLLKKAAAFVRFLCFGILNDRNFLLHVVLPIVVYACALGLLGIFLLIAAEEGMFAFVLVLFLAGVFNVGVLAFLYHQHKGKTAVIDAITRICDGDLSYQLEEEKLLGDNKILAQNINAIGSVVDQAVKTSLKDEKLKADLITNVSHDIKTPLTSIINYVDLLKKEDIRNEKARGYIQILDEKSQRLKQLILDLVETSKISSGNIEIMKEKLNMSEIAAQAVGEYSDRLEAKQLGVVVTMKGEKDEMLVWADSRHLWRILENLLSNICKYAMPGTRVYLDMDNQSKPGSTVLTLKNISEQPLTVSPQDLVQRFVRGDESRSAEGNGLGLSIAQTLTVAIGGTFDLSLDGDLFKVLLSFPRADEK